MGLLGNWGVCGIKSLLLKVFVKQNSCCVTVWRKLRSYCLSLCNHHKRTYQQSGSITHPHKQTVMLVNEAKLQPLKSETWLLWCSLMKANNGAEYWQHDATVDGKMSSEFCCCKILMLHLSWIYFMANCGTSHLCQWEFEQSLWWNSECSAGC